MTKTEATETIAIDVRVIARATGATINKDLVEARISELRGAAGAGTYKGEAAQLVCWRSVLRVARKDF